MRKNRIPFSRQIAALEEEIQNRTDAISRYMDRIISKNSAETKVSLWAKVKRAEDRIVKAQKRIQFLNGFVERGIFA